MSRRLVFSLAVLGFVAAVLPASSADASPPPGTPIPIFAHPGDVVNYHGVGVTVPSPGHGVDGTALTTTGSVDLQVWTTSDGQVYEKSGDAVSAGGGDGGGSAECSDTYMPGQEVWHWAWTFNWYLHSNTIPPGMNQTNLITDLNAAGNHITNENNSCGRPDAVSATQSYGGTAQIGTNIDSAAHCLTGDGISMTGFGSLPSGTLAYTCTWYNGSFNADESDARMNSLYGWYTDEGSGCQVSYNVDNVMTHERGHTFGMSDVYDSNHGELTMYGYISACKTNKETLSLGDMLRLESIY